MSGVSVIIGRPSASRLNSSASAMRIARWSSVRCWRHAFFDQMNSRIIVSV